MSLPPPDCRTPRTRPPRRQSPCPLLEPLDRRLLLAVTATFSAGTLRLTGDDQDNLITLSRNAAGALFVNNGAVPIQGDPNPTVATATTLFLVGAGGNDRLTLDETNGPLPAAALFGGAGDDTLTGGSGADFADGESGNDTASLGAGDDTFAWNSGDGSDVVDGQAGTDTLVFNASDLPEKFDLTDTGFGSAFHQARLTRDLGNVSLDLARLETIDLNPLGGADTITVNDQTATDIFTVNLDLAGTGPAGDGQPDAVILNGTEGDDLALVQSFGASIAANASLFPFVNIAHADPTLDALTINTLDGDDTIDASALQAQVKLTANGGAGNDAITGSHGNDLVLGGPGNDLAFLGDGDDTFTRSAGDGSDTVEGMAGTDTLNFNGSNLGETIAVSANGPQVRVTDDVESATADLDGIEQVAISPLGGIDNVVVNDLTGTALAHLKVTNIVDAQPDHVTVNGSNNADAVVVAGDFANGITVSGLAADVRITGEVGPTDALRLNTNGGNDRIDVDLDAPLPLSVDAGAGQDTLDITRTALDATARILPSPGDDTLNVATGDTPASANVSFDATQRIGALDIGAAGAAFLIPGGATTLTVTSLDIAGAGALNLANNSLILDYTGPSPVDTIQSLLKSGYNAGAWNGTGIASNLANASTFALGFAEASDVAPGGQFAGQAVDGTALLVKFTLYGDANLDGRVNFDDLLRLAKHYNSTTALWSQGDFSYDATVDFSDLLLLAKNYNAALTPAPRPDPGQLHPPADLLA